MDLLQSIILFITSVLFLLFLVNMVKDRRRFRNALLMLATLLFFALWFFLMNADSDLGNTILIFYALFTIVLVVIIPFLLILNGFLMIKREGFSIANLLSMLFGIFIFAGEFYLVQAIGNASDSIRGTPLMIGFFFGWLVFYISMIFLAFMVYTWLITILPHRPKYDYVIALGCGLLGGERVSKLLSGRLDKAIKIYKRSRSRTHSHIIVSGGQGPDEKLSEAEAMKGYLVEQGIPEADILMEDKSVNTLENIRNSKAIIDSREDGKRTAVCTSNYHVLRALIYARQAGLEADGIGSHTRLYYWPSAMIREFAGLMKIYFLPAMFGYLVTAVIFAAIIF